MDPKPKKHALATDVRCRTANVAAPEDDAAPRTPPPEAAEGEIAHDIADRPPGADLDKKPTLPAWRTGSFRDSTTDLVNAAAATPERSIVLVLKPAALPRAYVTDETGVTRPRVVDYVSLLEALDQSSVVTELNKDPVETIALPPLPDGVILVDLQRTTMKKMLILTGILAPQKHLFMLGDDDDAVTTHEIPLPHIVYRAVHDPAARTVQALSLALCSPGLSGEPDEQTELYRWPFSNVYETFGGVLEGVCWPHKHKLDVDARHIPTRIVREFIGMPNTTAYTRDLVDNAPVKTYREFLELVESSGGLEHDWLDPCSMNIQELHDQRRRDS